MKTKEFIKRLIIAQDLMITPGWSYHLALSKAGIPIMNTNMRKFKSTDEYKLVHRWYYQDERKTVPPLAKGSV